MSRSVLLKVGFLSGLDGDVAGFWRCYLGSSLLSGVAVAVTS